MKVLITGSQGLAAALASVYAVDSTVTVVSRSQGFDINRIDQWGSTFLELDCVFNCAYDGIGQVRVLEFFYQHWRLCTDKKIINIGSRSISFPRLDNTHSYWPYRQHKLLLQNTVDAMLADAQCDIKIINPGPIDTPMIAHHNCEKFDPLMLAAEIRSIVANRFIKRVDIWL